MGYRIVFPQPNEVVVEEIDAPILAEGQVLFETTVSIISPGTELRCLSGDYAKGTHWDNWIKYPFVPGYCLVGRAQGRRFSVRERHVFAHAIELSCLHPIPDDIDDETAIWAPLAMIGSMVLKAGEIEPSKRVLVIGAGLIGQMAARWIWAAGCHLTVLDPVEGRLAKAPADEHLTTPLAELEDRYDVVIDTTGLPAVFPLALARVENHGILVLLGDVGNPQEQGLTPDVLVRGVRIHGAHMLHEREGWRETDIQAKFFGLVRSGRFSVKELITHRFSPVQAPEAYAGLKARSADMMGVLFLWS